MGICFAKAATLAAPTHEKHVPLKLEKLQRTQSMAKVDEQPKNIRSWKRIMPSPNEIEVVNVARKKRKASTCMEITHDSSHKRLQIQNDQSSSSSMVEAT